MTDGEALLAAIRAQPDEDTPRLLYADEIEYDNPKRAEFIRLGIAIANLPAGVHHPDYKAWCKRDRNLLIELREEFRTQLPPSTPRWAFFPARHGKDFDDGWTIGVGRGFGERLILPTHEFLAQSRPLFASQPFTSVRLCGKTPLESVFDNRPNDTRHLWVWNEADSGDVSSVPKVLFDLLVTATRWHRGPDWAGYPSPQAADDALSEACVYLGRRRAGMTPLRGHASERPLHPAQ